MTRPASTPQLLARRLPAAIGLVALSITLAVHSDTIMVSWAMSIARQANYTYCPWAVRKLERQGEAGTVALLSLAMDYTPIRGAPQPDSSYGLPPLPCDSVCDIALDALRRLRKGAFAPRLFSYDSSAGEYPSYGAALTAYRIQELDECLGWWAEQQRQKKP